jgi:superfamily II RNA helicase
MVQGLRDTQPEAVKESSVAPLIAGVAAHHAGCLPGWKLLIERLFQEGLLKVVFATETLAAGINMPARTTLLTSLSKRRDDGISLLRHNELMQMAGRAGRRGYDTQGHCVIVQSKWDEPDAAWSILRKGPESLESKFAANYGMALNLLRTRTLEEAKEFLDRSFSMYLSSSFMSKKTREIERLEAQAESVLRKADIQTGEPSDSDANNSANAPLEAADPGELTIRMFEKLQGRRREEKRAAKLLRQQLADERGAIAETILSQKETPLPVGLDLSASSVTEGYKYYFLPALLVGCVDRDIQGNRYLCLGADNNLYIVYPPNIAAYDDRELDHDALVAASEDITARASALPAKAWSTLAKNVVRAEGSPATSAS